MDTKLIRAAILLALVMTVGSCTPVLIKDFKRGAMTTAKHIAKSCVLGAVVHCAASRISNGMEGYGSCLFGKATPCAAQAVGGLALETVRAFIDAHGVFAGGGIGYSGEAGMRCLMDEGLDTGFEGRCGTDENNDFRCVEDIVIECVERAAGLRR